MHESNNAIGVATHTVKTELRAGAQRSCEIWSCTTQPELPVNGKSAR
jgi:hypothetical protein